MYYTCLNEIRNRANKLSPILNAVTNGGKKPLPKEYADMNREWLELAEVFQNPAKAGTGIEIAESTGGLK